jgi:hypothetical protein
MYCSSVVNAYAVAGVILALSYGAWLIAGVYIRPLTAFIELAAIRDEPWWRDFKLVMGGFFLLLGIGNVVSTLLR